MHRGSMVARPPCHTAMATIPVAPASPICLISFHLAAKSSTTARHLFLDGEGVLPHCICYPFN